MTSELELDTVWVRDEVLTTILEYRDEGVIAYIFLVEL